MLDEYLVINFFHIIKYSLRTFTIAALWRSLISFDQSISSAHLVSSQCSVVNKAWTGAVSESRGASAGVGTGALCSWRVFLSGTFLLWLVWCKEKRAHDFAITGGVFCSVEEGELHSRFSYLHFGVLCRLPAVTLSEGCDMLSEGFIHVGQFGVYLFCFSESCTMGVSSFCFCAANCQWFPKRWRLLVLLTCLVLPPSLSCPGELCWRRAAGCGDLSSGGSGAPKSLHSKV